MVKTSLELKRDFQQMFPPNTHYITVLRHWIGYSRSANDITVHGGSTDKIYGSLKTFLIVYYSKEGCWSN